MRTSTIVGLVVTTGVVGVTVWLSRRAPVDNPAPPAASFESTVPLTTDIHAATSVSPKNSGSDQKAPPSAPRSLPEAIERFKAEFTDTRGTLDIGSARLAQWAATDAGFAAALRRLPSTSEALFRRDPAAERGKRLCISGRIRDIRAERNLAHRLVLDRPAPLVPPLSGSSNKNSDESADAPAAGVGQAPPADRPDGSLVPSQSEWQIKQGAVYFAVLEQPLPSQALRTPLVVEALAIGDAGKLVDGDSARFCGVLTGVNEGPGLDGSSVLMHRVVGEFELAGVARTSAL